MKVLNTTRIKKEMIHSLTLARSHCAFKNVPGPMWTCSALSRIPLFIETSMSIAAIHVLALYLHAPAMVIWFWASTLFFKYIRPDLYQEVYIPGRRRSMLTHIFIFAISYAVEAGIISSSSRCVADDHFNHNAVHSMVLILAHACLGLDLILLERTLMFPYIGSWTVGCFFECVFGIPTLLNLRNSLEDGCGYPLLLFRCTRALTSLAFIADQMSSLTLQNHVAHGNKHASTQQQSPTSTQNLRQFTKILFVIVKSQITWNTCMCFISLAVHSGATQSLGYLQAQQVLRIMEDTSWPNIMTWFLLTWLDSSAGLQWIQNYLKQETKHQLDHRIPSYRHTLNLSMDFHSKQRTAEIVASVQSAAAVSICVDFVFETVLLLGDLLVKLPLLVSFFGYSVAYLVFFVWVSYVWLGADITLWSRSSFPKGVQKKHHVLYDALTNWTTVSTSNQVECEVERFESAIIETRDAERVWMFRSNLAFALRSFLLKLGLLGVTTLRFRKSASATASHQSFFLLISFWRTAAGPMQLYEMNCLRGASITTELAPVVSLLEARPTVADGQERLNLKSGAKVEFRNVCFSYSGTREILTNLNFAVRPGQTVAFVGRTGSGKSTILGLIVRLLDPNSGQVLINGQDLRTIRLDSLRDNVGIAQQSSGIFDRSIMDNIKYAKPNATDEEVHSACKAACLHDRILSFPQGYQAEAGENGSKLSGGERQRLCLARVLVANPHILLLDEATSAMDSFTESQITAMLETRKGQTKIIVAHRLSSIKHADAIFVLEEGKIVEEGRHEELVRKGGKYSELWRLQSGGEQLRKTADGES